MQIQNTQYGPGGAPGGETEATVVRTGKDTFFGKTAAMLGGDKGRSSLHKLLLRIMARGAGLKGVDPQLLRTEVMPFHLLKYV